MKTLRTPSFRQTQKRFDNKFFYSNKFAFVCFINYAKDFIKKDSDKLKRDNFIV